MCWGWFGGIWFRKNEVMWKQEVKTTDQLVQHVYEFLHCWKGAWLVPSSQSVLQGKVKGGDVSWRGLGLGKLTCNIDGAIFADTGCTRWVSLVRNDEDDFVWCIFSFMKSTFDLCFLTKILAVREALFWPKSLHLDDVIMETDSQRLRQAFHRSYEDALGTSFST